MNNPLINLIKKIAKCLDEYADEMKENLNRKKEVVESKFSKDIVQSNQDRLIPLTMWPKYHDWPTVSSLRWMIFNDYRNGFHEVVVRCGRKVFINEKKFFEYIESNNKIKNEAEKNWMNNSKK